VPPVGIAASYGNAQSGAIVAVGNVNTTAAGNLSDVGTNELVEAIRHLHAHDIHGALKVLLKLSKLENGKAARNNPRMKEVLSQLYGQLYADNVSIWPRELADLALAMGELQVQDQVATEVLKRVAELAERQVDSFTPHDIAGIVRGFASLGMRTESLMSVIAAEVVRKIDGFDQRQLSNTAWAFAKSGLWNEQLVGAIAAGCLSKISTFTAQSLSQISWAMAQWRTRKDDLMNGIVSELQRKTSDFAPAPLAMIAWSFASLQLKSLTLMTAISAEAGQKIADFKTQDLAHLAWAFANLRVQDQALFNIVADRFQRDIKSALPPELANTAWAFSKNNFSHEPLMNAIAGEAIVQMRYLKPLEVATLAWAFAVARHQHRHLMTEIGGQVAKRIDKFQAPQLSHIAWAFGALALKHQDFLCALSAHVHRSMAVFKAETLSGIAWGFAMVRFRDEHLLRRMATDIARDIGDLRPLALARCAWAYRLLLGRSPELMTALVGESVRKLDTLPTKTVVNLVDSLYASPPVAMQTTKLEKALAARIEKVSTFFKQAWPVGTLPSITVEQYSSQLSSFGLLDCGIVGTPLLLGQLGIDVPSRSFLQECRTPGRMRSSGLPLPQQQQLLLQQQHIDFQQSSGGRAEHLSEPNRELTLGRLDIKIMDEKVQDWVIIQAGTVTPAIADSSSEEAAQWLFVADLPGRRGLQETTCLVLSETCSRIFALGIDSDSMESCSSVEGSIQLLSTVVPCLSTVGVLWQFKARFPSVSLTFVEQILQTGFLGVEHSGDRNN